MQILLDLLAVMQPPPRPRRKLGDALRALCGKPTPAPAAAEPAPPESLRLARERLPVERFRIAAGELLAWLASWHIEQALGRSSPLRNMQREGVERLKLYQPEATRTLLETTPALAACFVIDGALLRFQDEIDEAQRAALAALVHRQYRPPRCR